MQKNLTLQIQSILAIYHDMLISYVNQLPITAQNCSNKITDKNLPKLKP